MKIIFIRQNGVRVKAYPWTERLGESLEECVKHLLTLRLLDIITSYHVVFPSNEDDESYGKLLHPKLDAEIFTIPDNLLSNSQIIEL